MLVHKSVSYFMEARNRVLICQWCAYGIIVLLFEIQQREPIYNKFVSFCIHQTSINECAVSFCLGSMRS